MLNGSADTEIAQIHVTGPSLSVNTPPIENQRQEEIERSHSQSPLWTPMAASTSGLKGLTIERSIPGHAHRRCRDDLCAEASRRPFALDKATSGSESDSSTREDKFPRILHSEPPDPEACLDTGPPGVAPCVHQSLDFPSCRGASFSYSGPLEPTSSSENSSIGIPPCVAACDKLAKRTHTSCGPGTLHSGSAIPLATRSIKASCPHVHCGLSCTGPYPAMSSTGCRSFVPRIFPRLPSGIAILFMFAGGANAAPVLSTTTSSASTTAHGLKEIIKSTIPWLATLLIAGVFMTIVHLQARTRKIDVYLAFSYIGAVAVFILEDFPDAPYVRYAAYLCAIWFSYQYASAVLGNILEQSNIVIFSGLIIATLSITGLYCKMSSPSQGIDASVFLRLLLISFCLATTFAWKSPIGRWLVHRLGGRFPATDSRHPENEPLEMDDTQAIGAIQDV